MNEKIKENQEKSSSERLGQILSGLTTDQIRYVVARQDVSTDKAAAKQIGVSPDAVSRWKYEKVPIDEAVRLMALDGLVMALHIRKRNLAKAMAVKVAGLNSDDEKVRQGVATEVIEWEMGKATQRKEHSGPDGGPIETKMHGKLATGLAEFMALVESARARDGDPIAPPNNE